MSDVLYSMAVQSFLGLVASRTTFFQIKKKWLKTPSKLKEFSQENWIIFKPSNRTTGSMAHSWTALPLTLYSSNIKRKVRRPHIFVHFT